MSKFVLVNEYVTVGGVDLTTWCSSAELSFTVAEKDVTNYESQGWNEFLGGLKSGELKLALYEDFAASAVDVNVWPWLGTVQAFEVRAVNASRSATNPAYTGNVLVSQYNPLQGKVGDVDAMTLTWKTTAAITRATS